MLLKSGFQSQVSIPVNADLQPPPIYGSKIDSHNLNNMRTLRNEIRKAIKKKIHSTEMELQMVGSDLIKHKST